MKNINFTAIDLETANYENDAPVHFAVTIVKNGQIDQSFCKKINPERDIINYFEELDYLKPRDYSSHPTFPEVFNEILPILESSEYIVAHNANFDFKVIQETLERYNMSYPNFPRLLCSMVISRKLMPDMASYSLPWLSTVLGYEWNGWEPVNNTKLAAEILLKCIENGSVSSITELCDNYLVNIGSITPDKTYKKCLSKPKYTPGSHTHKLKASGIIADESQFDESNILYGAHVAFTGALSRLTRIEAQTKVANIGGIPQDGVTKTTNFLIVGQNDYRIVGESGISSKQRKAMEYKSKGLRIEILSESDFLDLF